MSNTNYNASQPAVPFGRVYRLIVEYPDNGVPPHLTIEQGLAVVLADGNVRKIDDLPTLESVINLQDDGNTPIQMVDSVTGEDIPGQTTSFNITFMHMLACIRALQKRNAS